MQPLVHAFVLILCVLTTSAHAGIETWSNNLSIDLPQDHDVMTADWDDLQCFAVNLYHEARGESTLGQEMVAQVVVNRINSKHYPDTACGVVRQNRQFSWTHDGRSDRPRSVQAYEQAFKIAIKYLYLKHQADVEWAPLLTNYHADSVSPDWGDLEVVHVEGRHVFYRPPLTRNQRYAYTKLQTTGIQYATYDRPRGP